LPSSDKSEPIKSLDLAFSDKSEAIKSINFTYANPKNLCKYEF
jgi:hypothetical protein